MQNVLLDINDVGTRGRSYSAKQRLEAFLRNEAVPGFQVGDEDSGIDQPSVSRSVHYICQRLVQLADSCAKFSLTWQRFLDVGCKIFISACCRAIDCTHIKIRIQAITYDALFFSKNILLCSLLSRSKCQIVIHTTFTECFIFYQELSIFGR